MPQERRRPGSATFAGVLALAMADLGTFAKLFAEAVEHVDRRPVEGVRATGAGALPLLRFAVLPQVLPVWLSTVLYYFESNVRSATILGWWAPAASAISSATASA